MKTAALVAAVLLIGGVSGVASLQPGLAKTAHDVKEGSDVYPFPPPAELHLATLGWDSAVVDLLWAKLLVDYGTHWGEHRDFLQVPQYANAMLELEPGYRPIYKYIDTMLAYRPVQGTEADVRTARAFLERGTRERPDDAELWMQYGSFIAFIAPSFLKDQGEIDRWRSDGAAAMGHAIDLGGDAERSLAVASILSKGGTNQAAIDYLQRAYAFTEHPSMSAVHEAIGKRLVQLQAQGSLSEADEIGKRINARWQAELPFLSRDRYLLLGPVVDAARCAGVASAEDAACSRDWSTERP